MTTPVAVTDSADWMGILSGGHGLSLTLNVDGVVYELITTDVVEITELGAPVDNANRVPGCVFSSASVHRPTDAALSALADDFKEIFAPSSFWDAIEGIADIVATLARPAPTRAELMEQIAFLERVKDRQAEAITRMKARIVALEKECAGLAAINGTLVPAASGKNDLVPAPVDLVAAPTPAASAVASNAAQGGEAAYFASDPGFQSAVRAAIASYNAGNAAVDASAAAIASAPTPAPSSGVFSWDAL